MKNNHYRFVSMETQVCHVYSQVTDFNEFTSVAFLEPTKLTSLSRCNLPHSDWLKFYCISFGRNRFPRRGKDYRSHLLLIYKLGKSVVRRARTLNMSKYLKGNVLIENFFYALWTVGIIHV